MNNQPLVSINILSFNRVNELRITLAKVYEQDYKKIEVIVVDNNSSDGSADMVRSEFPLVNLIVLEKNTGIAGWNEGFNIAKGEYILVLDDDAYPDQNAITIALRELQMDKDAACVTFNTIDLNKKNKNRTNWLPDLSVDKCNWPVFIGCAAIFDMTKLHSTKMPEDYFLYQHELPVSAEIYMSGYKILYNKEIKCFHKFKDSDIYRKNADMLVYKNNLNFIQNYLPVWLKLFYQVQAMFFYFLRSVNRKWFGDFLSITRLRVTKKKNDRSIPFEYFLELRKLHLFNFSIISKIGK